MTDTDTELTRLRLTVAKVRNIYDVLRKNEASADYEAASQ